MWTKGRLAESVIHHLKDNLARGQADGCIDTTFQFLMLHKADPLVRANVSELKRRYAGMEVLQYLLIDGDFRGAVCGHWRIGPHDVEDIVVDLPAQESRAREVEIVDAVASIYHPPSHRILRYNGRRIAD